MQRLGEIIVMLAFFNLFVEFMVAYVFLPLYKKYGWFKDFYHNVRECHIPEDGSILECGLCGLEKHAICKYCGKGIKQNWDGEWV